MPDTVIRVENLSKKYIIDHQQDGQSYKALRDVIAGSARSLLRPIQKSKIKSQNSSKEEFWALKDVSFEIKQGDRVGIIGRNGAGKSTLLKLLSRITEPTKGRIQMNGRVASLLEVGTGFHPELTGRENIYLNGAILGMSRVDIKRKFDEIVAFAEVEKFLDTPVKRYSSGMYVRLAFAVAAHLEPEILIVDEVLAVGDAQFQKKCLGKMEDIGQEGRTVIFVSHNMTSISQLCSRGIYLKDGLVVVDTKISEAIQNYVSKISLKEDGFSRESPKIKPSGCDIHDFYMTQQGNKISSLEWDEPFSFIATIAVSENFLLSVEFLIKDENQIPILFCPSGLYLGYDFEVSQGSYQIEAFCSGLRLASGSYYVDISLVESGKKPYCYYENALCFEILEKPYGRTSWVFTQAHRQSSIPLDLAVNICEI